MSSTVPMDVIFEILSFLPVTTLLKFRSVSKSWLNLITSSNFVESHLNRASQINNNNNNPRVFFTNWDNLLSTVELKDDAVLGNPIALPNRCPALTVGSCNGLVCLYSVRYLLCNPSTKVFREIPFPPVNPKNRDLHGFGYDDVLKDYKIVTISLDDDDNSNGVFIMVYTLGTNSWRLKKPHGCDRFIPKCGFHLMGSLVNGSLHWLVQDLYEDWTIISFNIVDEDFGEVYSPPGTIGSRLYVLGGCLCVLDCIGDGVDLWMMKDYGVEESWTKLFSTSHPELTPKKCLSKLLWIKENGEILVHAYKNRSSGGGYYLVYDPKTDDVKKFYWLSPNRYATAHVYIGSLVSIKSGKRSC